MIKGVHHVGLTVRSLDSSTRAFAEFAGAEVVSRFSLQDSTEARASTGLPLVAAKAAMLKAANAYVELFEFESPASPPAESRAVNAEGHTHICVQSRDLDGQRATFEAAGVSFFSPPVSLGTGYQYAYGRDADGAVFEQEAAPMLPATPGCWLGHVAFATSDITALVGFYRALLGAPQTGRGRIGPNPLFDQVTGLNDVEVDVAWLHPNNLTLEFWQFHNPPTVRRTSLRALNEIGYSHICLEVDDVVTERNRAIDLGATPQGGIVDGPTSSLSFVRDPDGNLLEFAAWRGDGEWFSVDQLAHGDLLRVQREAARERLARRDQTAQTADAAR